MANEWVSAAEAFELVVAVTGIPFKARRAICSRAFDGLVEAKATRLILDDRTADDAKVPRAFWWARGDDALTQDWTTGDFETWLERTYHLRAYGVSFDRSGIEAIVRPALSRRPPPADPAPAPNVGGRPPATWWDDLWIEIAVQLWVGDLKPMKQADLESAMMSWVAARGHDPADSTIRARARKLWLEMGKRDKN